MSERLLLATFLFKMAILLLFFLFLLNCTGFVLPPRPPARPVARLDPPPPQSSAREVGGVDRTADVLTVFSTDFFNDSSNAFRGGFFPATILRISGTNAETRFRPNSFATGTKYFFTNGTATRPILIAKAPSPPEPYWRAGPRNVVALEDTFEESGYHNADPLGFVTFVEFEATVPVDL